MTQTQTVALWAGFYHCTRGVRLVMILLAITLLAGCIRREPDLSGVWENEEVGTLRLTQTGNVLSAEQKDPEFAAYFGPKMFEGVIEDGLLKGRVAAALPVNFRSICGQNWGHWADLELRVAPDGLALEGRWLRRTSDVTAAGCPVTGKEWQPIKFTRGAGQPPVELNTLPKWVPALSILASALLAAGIRHAWVRYLIGSRKRSPNSAAASGWALFLGLLSASVAASLSLLGSIYATGLVWGPLVALSAFALLGAHLLGRK